MPHDPVRPRGAQHVDVRAWKAGGMRPCELGLDEAGGMWRRDPGPGRDAEVDHAVGEPRHDPQAVHEVLGRLVDGAQRIRRQRVGVDRRHRDREGDGSRRGDAVVRAGPERGPQAGVAQQAGHRLAVQVIEFAAAVPGEFLLRVALDPDHQRLEHAALAAMDGGHDAGRRGCAGDPGVGAIAQHGLAEHDAVPDVHQRAEPESRVVAAQQADMADGRRLADLPARRSFDRQVQASPDPDLQS